MVYVGRYLGQVEEILNTIPDGEFGLYIGKVEIMLDGEVIGYMIDRDGTNAWEFVETELGAP